MKHTIVIKFEKKTGEAAISLDDGPFKKCRTFTIYTANEPLEDMKAMAANPSFRVMKRGPITRLSLEAEIVEP